MQDPSFLPQHLVSTFAFALSFSVTAFSALGCSHSPPPEPQHARAHDQDRGDDHARDDDHTQAEHRASPTRTSVARVEHVEEEGPPPATAMDQSNAPADMEITRRIRAAVVTDAALSVGARNCTIITRGGVVTLRGDVTAAERDRIAVHVQAVPGVLHVDDLLVVP